MALRRYAYRLWFLFKKGILVFRREGLVKGFRRAWTVFKEIRNARSLSTIDTAIYDVKGMRYQKGKNTFTLRVIPDPQVSIIIPVLNGLDYVKECIDSIFASKIQATFEVIAIDQKSTDGTRQLLREYAAQFPNFNLIENPENYGFARAMNQGANISKGRYLVLANSDLIFTHGWLDPLLQAVQQDPEIGIISPLTNYVGEGPQLDLNAQEVKSSQANAYAQTIASHDQLLNVVDRLVFFCVLIRKNVYDLLGGLASIYALGNYEDDDFCLRARLAGYTLKIAGNSFVFHYGSKTFIRQKINYEKVMLRNEKIFFQRTVDFSLAPPLHTRRQTPKAEISVILRTKDRPFFLKQALSCLANQTFPNIEVVLVNDGNEDIAPVIAPYTQYLNIHTVQQPASGRSAALNKGLEYANGEWVTYLDDDDLLYPTHIENQVAAMVKHPNLCLAYTDANKSLCWVDDQQVHMVPLARERFAQRDFSYEELLFDNWIPIMSYVHRLDDALAIGGYNENLEIFEDWDFLLRLTHNRQVLRIPRITCEYRLRFGGKPDDSTLRDREKALENRKIIYGLHPSPNERVEEYRKATLEVVDFQLQSVRRIVSMPVTDLQKNFLAAANLGSFRSIKDSIQLEPVNSNNPITSRK